MIKDVRLPNWTNVYTVARVTQFCFFPVYNVVFDELPLLQTSTKEDAERIAAMCNGAYNLGHMSAMTRMLTE